jgi:hypothetical protein
MVADSSSVQFATVAARFGAWANNENNRVGWEQWNACNESEEHKTGTRAQAHDPGHRSAVA